MGVEESIFIQIAAYRDPELKPTLRDCIQKAKFPENLVFSICWQHGEEDVWDDLDEWKGDPRFRIIDVPAKDSKGTCWARSTLQKNYRGEKYTMHLDSHHRFVDGWDEIVIGMFNGLLEQGIPKPMLTAYIPSYDPANDPAGRLQECWKLVFARFGPEGPLHTKPWTMEGWQDMKAPQPARFASAHFVFTWGDHVTEVPHDPQGYFHGEEIALAVRSYTHGYDLYHPHKIVAWHEYGRAGKKRHWDDRDGSEWGMIQAVSHRRTRELFGMGQEPRDLGLYGLGKARSLADYERYAGVRFSDRKVQKYTLEAQAPPNPFYAVAKEYNDSFLSFFSTFIDIQYDQVPRDSDFWAVAVHDVNGDTIYRRDEQREQIERYFADPDGYCKIEVEFMYETKPSYWVVWPHTPNGWAERLSAPLPNEFDDKKESTGLKIENAAAHDVEVGNHFDVGENSLLIQILDEGYDFPKPKHNFKEVYQFNFCDWTTMRAPYGAAGEHEMIQKSQAEELASVLKHAKTEGMNIVVHCLYGRCRSTGVCEAAKSIGYDLVKNDKDYIPNRRVVDYIKEALGKDEAKVIAMVPKIKIELPTYKTFDIDGDYIAKFPDGVESDSTSTILVHIPAYREPELIPTIKDALAMAMHPERIHFGICRQFNQEDGFDDVDEFRDDPRFKIMDVPYLEAKGLPWARAQINDVLLTDEDYVLQLDSHHRFVKNWDSILIHWHKELEKTYKKPIIAGYSPMYSPFKDPEERTKEPWLSGFRCFYPFGTIYIGPQLLEGWEKMTKPPFSRFLCGHFDFARSQWAREVRHDPEIYFAGEEINLTVRSYTHGYDFFHPHRIVTWHATMREERDNICKWDDDNRRGIDWYKKQMDNRRKIRVMLGVEPANGMIIKPEHGLGTERTVEDYERYAGLDFKTRRVQEYTANNKLAPNPYVGDWEASLVYSNYFLVNIEKSDFPLPKYDFILVAFDDENGDSVKSYHKHMEDFDRGRIHYEEYFTSAKPVKRVVYWGHAPGIGWAERIEHNL